MRFSSVRLWVALPLLWVGPALAQNDDPNTNVPQPSTGAQGNQPGMQGNQPGSQGREPGMQNKEPGMQGNQPGTGATGREKMGASSQKLNRSDMKFFEDTVSANLLQIELGRLAQEKATKPETKDFGKNMVDEYTRANDDLRKIADAKGVVFPMAMNKNDKRAYDNIAKLSGDKFDKQYLSQVVKITDNNLKAYDRQAKKGVDADLKDYASRALPTLRQDRDTAQRDVKRM